MKKSRENALNNVFSEGAVVVEFVLQVGPIDIREGDVL